MASWARGPGSGGGAAAAAATATDTDTDTLLDSENRRLADGLATKVTRLKALALDMDRDAEEQNRYLDGMDSDFSSVTSLLSGSVKRFSSMTRSGRDNRRLLLGVSVGLIILFFFLSYLVSRART